MYVIHFILRFNNSCSVSDIVWPQKDQLDFTKLFILRILIRNEKRAHL